mgnify:FL=1
MYWFLRGGVKFGSGASGSYAFRQGGTVVHGSARPFHARFTFRKHSQGDLHMTQMGRYIAPDGKPGELGAHSVDHFSLFVPDLAEADRFYKSFGMDVQEESAKLVLRTTASKHVWGVIAEGSRKCLRYISFGAFEEDLPRFKERIEKQGIKLLDPPKDQEGGGLWFRDPDENLVEIKVAEKCSPIQSSS